MNIWFSKNGQILFWTPAPVPLKWLKTHWWNTLHNFIQEYTHNPLATAPIKLVIDHCTGALCLTGSNRWAACSVDTASWLFFLALGWHIFMWSLFLSTCCGCIILRIALPSGCLQLICDLCPYQQTIYIVPSCCSTTACALTSNMWDYHQTFTYVSCCFWKCLDLSIFGRLDSWTSPLSFGPFLLTVATHLLQPSLEVPCGEKKQISWW